MIIELEVFGPMRTSSLLGMWRGLLATILLLIVAAVATTVTQQGSGRILIGAVLFASALTVARRGTPVPEATIYGGLVGLVLGAAVACATGTIVGGKYGLSGCDFAVLMLGGALVGGTTNALVYSAESFWYRRINGALFAA